MGDVIISSNNESGLLQSLYKITQQDPFSYYQELNYPNMSKSIIQVSPQSIITAPFSNKNITFKLPRYGLLEAAYIRTTVTVGAASSAANLDNTMPGTRIYNNIALRTNNQDIFTQYPSSCLARMLDVDPKKATIYGQLTHFNVTMAGTAVGTVYTPIFFPCFEAKHMYLDLSFVEQLELNCQVNNTLSTTTGSIGFITDEPTAFTSTLFLVFRNLEYNALEAYQASNFGNGQSNLNMLVYDNYLENNLALSATTSFTLDLKCPNVAYATHYYILDSANAGFDISSGATADITSSTLKVSGRNIYENIPYEVLKFDASRLGKHYMKTTDSIGTNNNTTQPDGILNYSKKHVSLYYGTDIDRLNQVGGISFGNTNGPQIVINLKENAVATGRLICHHEFWKILSISPSDGRILVSSSL